MILYLYYFCCWGFISFVCCRNEALRVAFIHAEDSVTTDGKLTKEFYSKLVKADGNGKDQVDNIVNVNTWCLYFFYVKRKEFSDYHLLKNTMETYIFI